MSRKQAQKQYSDVASATSSLVMRRFSNSYNLATHLMAKQEREAVSSIYGFVRLVNEIVNNFNGPDPKQLLQEFKQDTYKAIKRQLSLNPILHSFALTAVRYKIDVAKIDAFFASMEADLTKTRYSQQEYERYVYGSGEAVGLMCLKVFAAGNTLLYQDLAPSAQRLGAAFQKVTFLRNFGSDFRLHKRLYIPNISSIRQFSAARKQQMEANIAQDFSQAKPAIHELPITARIGVAAAYRYYFALFSDIQRLTPAQLYRRRVSLPVYCKLWIALSTLILQGPLNRKL